MDSCGTCALSCTLPAVITRYRWFPTGYRDFDGNALPTVILKIYNNFAFSGKCCSILVPLNITISLMKEILKLVQNLRFVL